MNRRLRSPAGPSLLFLFLLLLASNPPTDAQAARTLSFEERVAAQEAIERVYYSHLDGATRPFEEAVPRAVLEKKVRKYLRQSAALDEFWATPVTAEALEHELGRIARDTRFPERLWEIYRALGDDPFLLQECLARPALVNRMSRSFFATDTRIHIDSRREAETLFADLSEGYQDIRDEDPRRRVMDVRRTTDAEAWTSDPAALELAPDAYDSYRALAPRRVGAIGQVREERNAFTIRALLSEDGGGARVA